MRALPPYGRLVEIRRRDVDRVHIHRLQDDGEWKDTEQVTWQLECLFEFPERDEVPMWEAG